MGMSLVGYSMPAFFIGLVLISSSSSRCSWLPFPHWVCRSRTRSSSCRRCSLPWIVLAILNTAFYMRLTRNQVLETFSEDYVRTARAKGLPERTVVSDTPSARPNPDRHGGRARPGRPAGRGDHHREHLQPAGARVAHGLIGQRLRPPLITGITLVAAFFIIVANLVVDLLYAVIDPRVRSTGVALPQQAY